MFLLVKCVNYNIMNPKIDYFIIKMEKIRHGEVTATLDLHNYDFASAPVNYCHQKQNK